MPRRQSVSLQVKKLTARLENRATSARSAGNRRMEKGAADIQQLARDWAPEDEGPLQDSIVVEKTQGRGADGRFGTNIFQVAIDEDRQGSNGAATVGKYATRIHESFDYRLGRLSRIKDVEHGGNGDGYPHGGVVGPKFLTRAAEYSKRNIEKEVAQAVKRGLK